MPNANTIEIHENPSTSQWQVLCLLDVNLLGTKLFIIPADMMSGKKEWNPERDARTRPHMHTHTHTHAHIHMVA